ncbi:MAG: hypothetical protein ACYDEX_24305, partial [Mobilitalea sp.]
PTLLAMFLAGAYIYKSRLKTKFVLTLFLFGSIFFATAPLLLTSDSGRYAMRTWSFSFIGLSLFIAIPLNQMFIRAKRNNGFYIPLILTMLILVIGGMSIGQGPMTRIPSNPNLPTHSTGANAYTNSFILAGGWVKEHDCKQNLIGDLTIRYMFGGYSDLNVNVYKGAVEIILEDNVDENRLSKFGIIAINNLLGKYPIYVGDVKDSYLTKVIGPNTIAAEKLAKFNFFPGLNRNYDNGKTTLFGLSEVLHV